MGRNTHSKSTRMMPIPRDITRKVKDIITPTPTENIVNIEGLDITPKKIKHVQIFPENYPSLNSLEIIGAFCELVSKVGSRYEKNTEIIRDADGCLQDLLHEVELLPPVNSVGGYQFYKRIREKRIIRRVAKTENRLLHPLYSYLAEHPDFLGEIKNLLELTMKAQFDADHTEYVYRSEFDHKENVQ